MKCGMMSEMQAEIRIEPLEEADENRFVRFLERDKILHVFTLYDMRNFKDKTRIWIALKNDYVLGYLFVFNDLIINTHGAPETMGKLLNCISLTEPTIVIESQHLETVKKLYEPVGPTDAASKGKITTYLVMRLSPSDFNPTMRHSVRRLGTGDLNEVVECLGEEWKTRVENAISRSVAYGAYLDRRLASLAIVPEIVDGIGFIRGVYTTPEHRNKGLAASACSALAKELMESGQIPVLWVAEDNVPARRIYEKLGFRRTGYTLLGFKAKKIS
jgi:GNAT superfamily N-acetyltransferase